jgi:uncharacterized membrane protein HdeD (DUF308 family)
MNSPTLDTGSLIRVLLAAAYAIYALVLITFPGKATQWRIILIGIALIASGVTLFNTFGFSIPPWPAFMTLLFLGAMIHATIAYRT